MWVGRRRRRAGLPDEWEAIGARTIGWWRLLDDGERERLGRLMEQILLGKRWEAARGFALTDEMRTVISATAALLVLELDDQGGDPYRDVQAVIVHPTTVTFRGARPGPAPGLMTDAPLSVIGQAHARRGPVIVAWDAARAGARHPERGHDVVLHEFAHKLDMLDDLIDGTPPLPDRAARERWIAVCTTELRLLRMGMGGHLLSSYAATNPAEFFAVATEVFFGRPLDLREHKPALYEVFGDFYRQDPAARLTRYLTRRIAEGPHPGPARPRPAPPVGTPEAEDGT
jgi:Mlc titration factor MtfA (ptsG expression regulator)